MRARHPPIVRSVAALLTLTAATLTLLTAAGIDAGLAAGDGPLWLILVSPASTLIFLATGAAAIWLRPNNHTGVIMVGGAAAVTVADLPALDIPVLTIVAVLLATVILAVLVHLLLAFPSGHLRSPAARHTVLAGYAVCLVLQSPRYLFDPAASPGGVLAVADNAVAATVGGWIQSVAGLAVMMAAAALLASRFRRADRVQRRVLGPLYLYGIAAVLAVPVIGSVIRPFIDASTAVTWQMGLVTAVPVAIGYAMVSGGFARTGNIQELGAWLSIADDSREALQSALARTLGDPSVRLAFWSAETGGLVDEQGRLAEVGGPGRGSVDVEVSGHRVATIDYDAVLIDHPASVSAAGRVVAVAIDRARIAAELRASRDELRESRSRIVQAGDDERRRLAQDLHDGLQSQLVLLGIQAQALADKPASAVAEAATDLRRRIDDAAADLRGLVHAVLPPALTSSGLVAAVEDLLDRIPVRTRLEVTAREEVSRAAPHAQSIAYFVIAEGLTNAVKHSEATAIEVRMTASDGQILVDVIDNGIGEARTITARRSDPRQTGLGMRSIADRVSAIGGRLAVVSPAAGGIHLRATLPCA